MPNPTGGGEKETALAINVYRRLPTRDKLHHSSNPPLVKSFSLNGFPEKRPVEGIGLTLKNTAFWYFDLTS